jgi:hypothetical protein
VIIGNLCRSLDQLGRNSDATFFIAGFNFEICTFARVGAD